MRAMVGVGVLKSTSNEWLFSSKSPLLVFNLGLSYGMVFFLSYQQK